MKTLAAGALFVGMVAYAISSKDWELLTTKHYWSRGFYYSGYALQYLPSGNAFRAIHAEAQANLVNLDPLTESGPYPWPVLVQGFPGTERLLAPFLAAIVLRVGHSAIDIPVAFGIVNFLLWSLAVLFSYRLAAVYFTDRTSPFIAAALCSVYPTFTLTLRSLKVQQMGAVCLLAGMLLFERHITRCGPLMQFVAFLALIWVGLFASGGWAFVCVYVVLRVIWRDGREGWKTLALLAAAVLVAHWGLNWLTQVYKLPSVEDYLGNSFGAILVESLHWMQAWLTSGDPSSHKLLNYQGLDFFQKFIPLIITAFVRGHFWLLLTALAAAAVVPRARMLLTIAVPMFFVGHAGTALVGWQWHYGYLSAPAALLLILAASGALGHAIDRVSAWHTWRAVALIAFLLIVVPWLDLKTHAGLYLAGNPDTYQVRVIVHFEGIDAALAY